MRVLPMCAPNTGLIGILGRQTVFSSDRASIYIPMQGPVVRKKSLRENSQRPWLEAEFRVYDLHHIPRFIPHGRSGTKCYGRDQEALWGFGGVLKMFPCYWFNSCFLFLFLKAGRARPGKQARCIGQSYQRTAGWQRNSRSMWLGLKTFRLFLYSIANYHILGSLNNTPLFLTFLKGRGPRSKP